MPGNETTQQLRKRFWTILRKKNYRSGPEQTNLVAQRRRDWWVHSTIAHQPRTTNRPPPTKNNHESKWQNKPKRTTRRTTSRPWLLHKHADTTTRMPDKNGPWTPEVSDDTMLSAALLSGQHDTTGMLFESVLLGTSQAKQRSRVS